MNEDQRTAAATDQRGMSLNSLEKVAASSS